MSDDRDGEGDEDAFQARLRDFAHEIRTPLNAMIGYAHLIEKEIEEGLNPDTLRDYNQTIKTSTVRLLKICERVLEDAISGGRSVRAVPVNMAELAERILETFKQLASERRIELIMEFAEDFPEVLTDPLLVEQVLSNLVSNAIKFTPTGGTITLRGEVDHDDKAMIFLIRDTGQGIPDDMLEKIRKGEPLPTSRNSGPRGWGRGLKISREICELLGATLEFAPADTGGTIVMFKLPLPEGGPPG